MILQYLIVFTIVGSALAFVIFSLFRFFRTPVHNRCTGCSGCSLKPSPAPLPT
jgi:hypothetical protein